MNVSTELGHRSEALISQAVTGGPTNALKILGRRWNVPSAMRALSTLNQDRSGYAFLITSLVDWRQALRCGIVSFGEEASYVDIHEVSVAVRYYGVHGICDHR